MSPFQKLCYTPEKIKSIAESAAGDFPFGSFESAPAEETAAMMVVEHFSNIKGTTLVGRGFHNFPAFGKEISTFLTFAVETVEAIEALTDIALRLRGVFDDAGLGPAHHVDQSFIRFTNGNGYYLGVCIQFGSFWKGEELSRVLLLIDKEIASIIPTKYRKR